MNERRQKPLAGEQMRCECECHRVECFNNIAISAQDYAEVRAHSRYFVVAPGHQRPDESVIHRTREYLVTETRRTRPAGLH